MADENQTDDILSVIDDAHRPDAGDTGDEGEEYVEGSPPSDDAPAGDAETTESDAEAEEAPKPEPKKSGIDKRIGELTKARYEAERRVTAAEAKAQAYEELLKQFPNLAQPVKAPDVAAPVDDPEPTEENFRGSYEELEEAKLSWRVRRETEKAVAKLEADREAKAQQLTEKEQRQARAAEDEKRATEFLERAEKDRPGFIQSVAHMHELMDAAPAVARAIVMMPEGPDVLLYLSRKSDEAERIAALPPMRQAVEIGVLSERVRVARAAKKNTNADPPINPLGGSSAPVQKDPEKMSMAEYKAWRAGKGK